MPLSLTRLRSLHPYPDPAALLDIHLKEKRVEAALALYDQQSTRFRWGGELRLVGLMAADHPDRAIRIWATHAERLVAQTRPDADREALPHLKKVRQAYAVMGSRRGGRSTPPASARSTSANASSWTSSTA